MRARGGCRGGSEREGVEGGSDAEASESDDKSDNGSASEGVPLFGDDHSTIVQMRPIEDELRDAMRSKGCVCCGVTEGCAIG